MKDRKRGGSGRERADGGKERSEGRKGGRRKGKREGGRGEGKDVVPGIFGINIFWLFCSKQVQESKLKFFGEICFGVQ